MDPSSRIEIMPVIFTALKTFGIVALLVGSLG